MSLVKFSSTEENFLLSVSVVYFVLQFFSLFNLLLLIVKEAYNTIKRFCSRLTDKFYLLFHFLFFPSPTDSEEDLSVNRRYNY